MIDSSSVREWTLYCNHLKEEVAVYSRGEIRQDACGDEFIDVVEASALAESEARIKELEADKAALKLLLIKSAGLFEHSIQQSNLRNCGWSHTMVETYDAIIEALEKAKP